MFVEVVDHLRCPVPHADSWLVLRAEETVDRYVRRGTLGCPVCRARYVVADGVADLAGDAAATPAEGAAAAHDPAIPADGAIRLAAFLDLGEGRGAVGLLGAWTRHAAELASLVTADVLAIDPVGPVPVGTSGLIAPGRARLPLATGALRALALDAASADAAAVAAAVRVVRSGGRLLAPAAAPVPDDVRVLARDAAWWVGERGAAASGVVAIGRRRGPG